MDWVGWDTNTVEANYPVASISPDLTEADTDPSCRYCQLKPDLADWTCGAHSVFPDKSMDSLQTN